jgi:hypothetical protein
MSLLGMLLLTGVAGLAIVITLVVAATRRAREEDR